ncbi:L-type lectin-domain containing protein [Paractinoplanes rishiriensis]|uniref:Legume lectin domain-containing protein n=1 Tax=Paractinoplanes rishiriensis TaxID=1050105 RepID=A0A919K5N1_9ACTN|nr:L-type lectin-domain containing protein [Actinoplanes rishiriensis]GIE97076.1 hypothetical protein Ari01nite_45410 [Actinoplanes rishiriensis]
MRQNAWIAVAATTLATLAVSSPAAASTTITHETFADASGLVLNGTAAVTGGVLRLTSGQRNQAGAAWSATTVDPGVAFDTTFDVRTSGPAVHADGFAFVVQTDGSRAIGGLGGSLGYGGMTRSVAVEFDTYRNRGEIDGNHVAVVTGGLAGAHRASAAAPVPIFGGRLHVRIEYAPEAKRLTVALRRAGEPWTHVLTREVDLAETLGTGRAHVGFTAATGRSVSTQDIVSWRLAQAG